MFANSKKLISDNFELCKTDVNYNPNWEYSVTVGGAVMANHNGHNEVVCWLPNDVANTMTLLQDYYDYKFMRDGSVMAFSKF